MVVCVPVTHDGQVDPRWGRASRVAVAEVTAGAITAWQEIDVGWDDLHDAAPHGGHHGRVAGFLHDHRVTVVVAHHMGEPMKRMLDQLSIEVRLESIGDARHAVLAAAIRLAN
jgi:predicted Fe-Mo cluster-binding NifX family protein